MSSVSNNPWTQKIWGLILLGSKQFAWKNFLLISAHFCQAFKLETGKSILTFTRLYMRSAVRFSTFCIFVTVSLPIHAVWSQCLQFVTSFVKALVTVTRQAQIKIKLRTVLKCLKVGFPVAILIWIYWKLEPVRIVFLTLYRKCYQLFWNSVLKY